MFITMIFLLIEMALEFMLEFIMIHQYIVIDHYLMYFNQISQ